MDEANAPLESKGSWKQQNKYWQIINLFNSTGVKSPLSLFFSFTITCAIVLASSNAFAEPYLFDLLTKPTYKKSWNAMFATERNIAPWLAQYAKSMDGPTSPRDPFISGKVRYQISMVCKTHDCIDNQFYVLFSPNGAKAWGMLLRNEKYERFFGEPDEEMKSALRTEAYKH